jgi:hypothetical protein
MAEVLIDSFTTYVSYIYDALTNVSAYNGSSQSFVGNGLNLSSCKWYLQATSSPTGNIVSKLYAMSGTPSPGAGDNKPTGVALATSNAVDASTVPTDITLTTFTFSTSYTLANGTYYCITCEYLSGNFPTAIRVLGRSSTYSTGGNGGYKYGSTWYADTHSEAFYVYGISAPTTSISKVNGVAQANISKIAGVSLASIKKVNGVANS